MTRALALAVAAGALWGCGGEPVSEAPSAIIGGTQTAGDPAVVALVTRRLMCTTTPPLAFCTGVLVAPRVVLTAAHCLEDKRPGEIRVLFGSAVGAADGELVDVTDARSHDAYDPSTQRFDFALLRLALPSDVTPIPMSPAPLDASLIGKSVRIVGFGVDEGGSTGVKRTGTALVSMLDDESFRYVPGPALSCAGDSGGPAFFDDGKGERLIGITRSGDAACAEYATALRVDPVLTDFVDPYVEASSAAPAPPVFDVARDDCAQTCATDDDCPLAMMCLAIRNGGRHCGLPGLQNGRFGEACAEGDACAGGACVAVGDACRCFSPCPATKAEPQDAGGCAIGAGAAGWPAPWAALATLCALARRRRSRGSMNLVRPWRRRSRSA